MRCTRREMTQRSIGLALFALVLAVRLEAQAWLAPRGHGTVSLAAEYLNTFAHTTGTGLEVRNIDLVAKTITVSLDYSTTDRLAIGLSVPYIESRYEGANPHPGAAVDDGTYHGTVTDFGISVRYVALNTDSITLTPVAFVLIPLHDYATMGHGAPGKGLYELGVGINAGHELVTLTPGLFVQGRYTYTFVEKISELSVNRSNADVLLSYVVHPRVVLTGNARWQETHGGLTLPLTASDASVYFHEHDQLARVNYFRAGAGLSYMIGGNVDLFANYDTVVGSENSHVGDS